MFKFKLSKKQLGLLILILSLGFGVLAYFLRNRLIYLQNLGYLGVFIVNLIGSATIILPVPALLTTVVAGTVLNPLLAGIFSAMGSTIGELTGYYTGIGGGGLIEKDKNIQKVEKWMDKYGLWVVFVLAAIPNPLFDLAGIVSGASGIPVRKYLIAVL
ncbi:MAG: VTT domain-containing protein, partial [Candidatus Woesebacteria bacterium]|nr:VTT domain-containing protein [Candidatus Woesebacteria bacterium]